MTDEAGGAGRKRGPKSKPERFPMRVVKGAMVPADYPTTLRLRSRSYRNGDLVFAEFRKPRNPKFHRLAHALGQLFVENIEAFDGVDAHDCLKRLQLESGVGCDEVLIRMDSVWPRVVAWVGENIGEPFALVLRSAVDALGVRASLIPQRIPRSLSFESMQEPEFKAVVAGLCHHVSMTYWPSLTAEQIEAMADAMVESP